MGEQEYGTCEVCGEDAVLVRTYFYFDIKCECHSPIHFEVVSHCMFCKPKEPTKTVVHMNPIRTT